MGISNMEGQVTVETVPIIHRAACRVAFQREEGAPWEMGVAVCRAPGLSDLIVIVPDDAESPVDVLLDVHNYERREWMGAFVYPVGTL